MFGLSIYFAYVALFPWCTFSVLHSFRAAVFSCFTIFIVHYLCVALFYVALLYGALFPCCNFSILDYFHISLFLLLFMFSSCCTFSMLLFPCSVFLYSHAAYLRWLFSCCAVSILHSFYVQCPAWIIRKPRSDCIFFMCCVKCVIK